jgi:hypothetical protein
MDVDTRIAPNAISNIVRYALSQHASMVSVLPRREDSWRASVLFSPLRYFWEILFHARSLPATASNAWLINRQVLLEQFNGFEALKAVVQPESKLSASLAMTDKYRFLISTAEFGVAYEKKWRSQLVTSTRLLFPLLENKTFLAIIAVIDLVILLIPTAIVVSIFLGEFGLLQLFGVGIFLLYASMYGWYLRKVWNKGVFLGALLWPILLLQEIILVTASLYQYKRRTVKWKGRKVLASR